MRHLALCLIAMAILTVPAAGQAGRDRVQEGNRLYQEGR